MHAMTDPARILVVDAPAVAAHFTRLLRWAGHAVETVRDHAAALACLDATGGGFDVMVIDFDAPPGVALAAMRALRERHRGVVPIVTVAWAQPTTAVALLKLGAADYLVKPVAAAALLGAVDAAAARRVLLGDDLPLPTSGGADEPATPPVKPSLHDLPDVPGTGTLAEALAAAERRVLLAALEEHGWSRGRTAARLGIDRTTLYKKIKRFALDRPGVANGR